MSDRPADRPADHPPIPAITRTPTETLIVAMEEADGTRDCLIIMTHEDGSILTIASSPSRIVRLGLIETAKAWMLADMAVESLAESLKEGD